MAASGSGGRMYSGSFQYFVFFCAEGSDRLPQGTSVTFFLLPLFGLCIVFLYEKFGKDDGGTNQVLSTVRSQDDVPWRSGPLIFISTALTHLAGVQQDVRVQLFSLVAALPIFLADGSILMRKTVM